MARYATLTDLVQRADGDEVVGRSQSHLRLRYRHEVPTSNDLNTVDDPLLDDCVLVADESVIYRYDTVSWQPLTLSKVGGALDDASAVADGYLLGRYELPLAGVPRALVVVVCDIARYNLYDDHVTDAVKHRHSAAMAWLKNVAGGTVNLDVTVAVPSENGTGVASIDGPDRVFSRDSMSGF